VAVELSRARFEELVADAIDSLPPELGSAMDNVAVVVDRADGRPLYGLYQGVPLTKRGSGYMVQVPDRITIFEDTISAHANSEAEVAALVRRTVLHEIGHHFGISDARLHELGWA
jgi:predicted Zn-dependent protease with MMP-like domain